MAHSFTLVDPLALADLQVLLARAGRLDDGVVRLVSSGPVLAVYVGVLHPSGLLDRSPTVLGLRTFALAETAESLVDIHPSGHPEVDAVVAVRALADRIARLQSGEPDAGAPVTVELPVEAQSAPWVAISPPRSGWTRVGAIGVDLLERTAQEGIGEVASGLPTGTGEQIVQRVRSEVWGRAILGEERIPAGGAFAALSLGFLPPGVKAESTPTRAAPVRTLLDRLLLDSAPPAPASPEPAPSDVLSSDVVSADVGPAETAPAETAPSETAPPEQAQVFEAGRWLRLSTRRGHVLIKRSGDRI